MPRAGCSCWVQMWDGKHPSVVSCTPTLALHMESCCPYPAWPALCILAALDTRPLTWNIPVPASLRSWLMGRGRRSWSIAPSNLELGACVPVFCSTGPPERSLRGDPNKSHYSSLKKRSQIFLKRKKATSGHC